MKILVTDIENANKGILQVKFDDYIEDIKTEGKVLADLVFKDLSQTIQVEGTISASMVLQCNRCLEDFVFDTKFDINECYYKDELFTEYKQERELKLEALGQDLCGNNEIDVTDLIYQSLILAIPNNCVCDINCNGGSTNLSKYLQNEE